MRSVNLLLAAVAFLFASCSDKSEYTEFEKAETTGRHLVEAIRNFDPNSLHDGLTAEASAEISLDEITGILNHLEDTCGNLAEPALFDVKILAEEDFEEDETSHRKAIQIYAAMLCDGTGSSDAGAVDVTLRLLPVNGEFKLIDWYYEPISHP